MKIYFLLFLFPFLFFSCLSTEQSVHNAGKKAEKILKKIEKEVNNGDVEKLADEFKGLLEEYEMDLSDFKDSSGRTLDAQWFEDIKKSGWMRELEKNIEYLAEELKSMDSRKIEKYTIKIKETAQKLGNSFIETTLVISKYIKEKAIEISTSDLFKSLEKIWNEE